MLCPPPLANTSVIFKMEKLGERRATKLPLKILADTTTLVFSAILGKKIDIGRK